MYSLHKELCVIPDVSECRVHWTDKMRPAFCCVPDDDFGVHLPNYFYGQVARRLFKYTPDNTLISNLLKARHLDATEINLCRWCILHEVGHYVYVRDHYKFDHEQYFRDKKKTLDDMTIQSYKYQNRYLIAMIYRELPAEKAADQYALYMLKEFIRPGGIYSEERGEILCGK